jgi:PAS domain S-box-containing protein
VARRVEAQAIGAAATQDAGAADELRILLVDDRPENLQALEAVLSPLGVPLASATSGSQALRLLLERDYAVILLDVRMPGLDGIETARLIKSRERSRDIPIVFLTAARDDVEDIVRGYEVGAIDYVLKPFDADLLRSKVAIFVELQRSRRALERSEATLRASFEAAPIGKTLLDSELRIVRANPAFGRLVDREIAELEGVKVTDLCDPADRGTLLNALERISHDGQEGADSLDDGIDLRLESKLGTEVWVSLVASSIETTELTQQLLLAQWIDLSSRRRAEQARADLLLEQSARTQAEAIAERLHKLQELTDALGSLSLGPLLTELAVRISVLFGADASEVLVEGDGEHPLVVRASGGHVLAPDDDAGWPSHEQSGEWVETRLRIERTALGMLSLHLPARAAFGPSDMSLLHDAADRAALAIRQAQLYEEEHRIAGELQRGLLPKRLPVVEGIELAAHYQAAGGVTAEVGGDWYDAFALVGGRLGLIVGDVAGRGIPAASTMGQLRSIIRAFALGEQRHPPGEVLTRLNRYQLALGEDQLFTVVYAIIDPQDATITWANAGHLPPLMLSQPGEPRYLHGGAYPMGIEDSEYKTMNERLEHGGALMLYTDGLVERRGESLDAGLARLAEAAAAGPEEPAAMCKRVLEQVMPPESQLHDDVTALIAKITQPG